MAVHLPSEAADVTDCAAQPQQIDRGVVIDVVVSVCEHRDGAAQFEEVDDGGFMSA